MLRKLNANEIFKASMDSFHLCNDDISQDFTRRLLCLRRLLNTTVQTIMNLVFMFNFMFNFCTTYSDVITARIIYVSLPVTVDNGGRVVLKIKINQKLF